MNPIEILYSWQALLCASACVGVTQLVKRALDVRLGEEARKASRLLSVLALPTLPIVVGALYALAVPMAPEALTAYLDAHGIEEADRALSLAAWGAACGQFSTWTYERAERWMRRES